MNTNKQSNPTIIVSGIQMYLENKYKRLWSHYVETADECYYLENGVKIPAKEFESLYPINELEIA